MDSSVKFQSFFIMSRSLIIHGNHYFPFEFILMDLSCTPKELNAVFIHFIIDKPNTKPNWYINIDRKFLKTFNLVVKSLGISISFSEDIPQPLYYTRICWKVSSKNNNNLVAIFSSLCCSYKLANW